MTGSTPPRPRGPGCATGWCPCGEVLETAKAFAHRFAELPAQSVRDTKRALNMHLLDSANNVLNFALAAEHESFGTDDIKARVAQFLAKDGKKSTDALRPSEQVTARHPSGIVAACGIMGGTCAFVLHADRDGREPERAEPCQ